MIIHLNSHIINDHGSSLRESLHIETIQKIQAARGQFTNWFIFVVIRYIWMIWGENRVL